LKKVNLLLRDRAEQRPLTSLLNIYKTIKPQFKILDKQQKSIPSKNKSKQKIRFFYIRYADDWVLFTNTTKERTEEFLDIFTEYLTNTLKLTLSTTKTKITQLQNKIKTKAGNVHFLGFQLSYYSHKRTIKIGKNKIIKNKRPLDIMNKRTIKISSQLNTRSNYSQRTTNPTLIAAFDRDRVFKKLESLRFIKKRNGQWQGCRKAEWGVLEIPEIVQRYNYIIRGYANFYGPITHYPNDIAQLHYLLRFSCLHTLSQKLHCTLQKVTKKFSKNFQKISSSNGKVKLEP
jgi:hypothetical protein